MQKRKNQDHPHLEGLQGSGSRGVSRLATTRNSRGLPVAPLGFFDPSSPEAWL